MHEAQAWVQQAGPDAREPILPKRRAPSPEDRLSSSDGLSDEEVLSDTEPTPLCTQQPTFPDPPSPGGCVFAGGFSSWRCCR